MHKNTAPSQDSGLSEATLLFVDDESDMLEAYEALFGRFYDVRTANNGEQALSKFGQDIDFVFIDRRMPEMSGEELIQRLREQGAETQIAILSAIEPDEEFSATYDMYFTKPIDKKQIQSAINQHLS